MNKDWLAKDNLKEAQICSFKCNSKLCNKQSEQSDNFWTNSTPVLPDLISTVPSYPISHSLQTNEWIGNAAESIWNGISGGINKINAVVGIYCHRLD